MPKKVYTNIEIKQRILEETKILRDEISELRSGFQEELFNRVPDRGGWNAYECFHHLNLTYKAYLPNIHKGVTKFNGTAATEYKSGFAGDRMIRSMAPSKGDIPESKKVKTFKKINPDRQPKFVANPIDRFLEYTDDFEALVEQIENYDLGKIRVNSLIGPVIRFKLGDALQIVHVHNKRHIIQAKKALLNS